MVLTNATLFKKETPVTCANFLKKSFLQNTSERLLLNWFQRLCGNLNYVVSWKNRTFTVKSKSYKETQWYKGAFNSTFIQNILQENI